jgi:glucose-6-phosphate 1-epimerase
MRAAELSAEFGIDGSLDFAEAGGLVKAVISRGGLVGEVHLQGAQVTAWQPRGERPVLFTSPNSAFVPGRSIRGGIPIVFPWFGASRHTPPGPQHGFARTALWHLDSLDAAEPDALTLTFSLGDSDVSSSFWPQRFRATYTVVFANTLSLCLAVENLGTRPIVFEEALHTYLAISDIGEIAISGLAGTMYIDKTSAEQRRQRAAGLLSITAETDRVYLDTPSQCTVEDSGWRQRTVVVKDGAASTVVWNPWAEKAAAMADLGDLAWRGMVCIETGNIADNKVRLAADAEHRMSTAIAVHSRW